MGFFDMFEEFVEILQEDGRSAPQRQYQQQPQAQLTMPVDHQNRPPQRTPEPRCHAPAKTLYHATSRAAAEDILYNGYWVVGPSTPRGIWLADSKRAVQSYKDKATDGKVVIMKVAPYIKLRSIGGGVYVYEIPNAESGERYHIPGGIIPAGYLD